jgi:hypothetical protein
MQTWDREIGDKEKQKEKDNQAGRKGDEYEKR